MLVPILAIDYDPYFQELINNRVIELEDNSDND